MSSNLVLVSARDPRLDFFRGLAMFLIFISHVPNNPWTLWIPARFGFSDATEIFVFCSGMASAFAFGRLFRARGWLVGTARILLRVWQIYWVHVGLFIALATTLAGLDAAGRFGGGYVNSLNLEPFFADPMAGLMGFLTLTYVPNYFDILPMYLGILAMLPIVVAAHGIGRWAAATLVLGLWLVAQFQWVSLPADPWTERSWFFNPFGWQLIFFTGFALASGWMPAPPVRRDLVWLAVGVLILSVPFAYHVILQRVPFAQSIAQEILPLTDKSRFGGLRYLHFLALAYLAFAFAGPRGEGLSQDGLLGGVTPIIRKVGQQALATFVVGSFLARMTFVAFNIWGKGPLVVTAVNFVGFGVLILTAYIVGWFRQEKAPGTRVSGQVRPSLVAESGPKKMSEIGQRASG